MWATSHFSNGRCSGTLGGARTDTVTASLADVSGRRPRGV